MTDPVVSVIIASCCGGEELAQSVRSVLGQTGGDFECIVIDDSLEGNAIRAIVPSDDSRIVLIDNGGAIGLTRSLNKGIAMARGKYIARLDAGDECCCDRLRKQSAYLDGHPDIFLVGSGAEVIGVDGRRLAVYRPIAESEALHKALATKNQIFHPSIMFRRADDVAYREKFVYAQDYDLYLRLVTMGRKLANLPEPLIRYRISPDSISYTKRLQQTLFAERARVFYRERLARGTDSYERFSPEEILAVRAEESSDPLVLFDELRAAFESEDRQKLRRLYPRYFGLTRKVDRALGYVVVSFFPLRLERMMKRLYARLSVRAAGNHGFFPE